MLRPLAAAAAVLASQALVEYVDPFIGTGGVGFGIGSLNPGAQVPFGCMRLGPDTTDQTDGVNIWLPFNHFGGYYYGASGLVPTNSSDHNGDTSISAFSHTHMVGPGIADWGSHGIMVTRSLTAAMIYDSAKQMGYASRFSHANETAAPGYYAVHLTDAATYAELTVSGTHSGMHRYTCEAPPSGSGIPSECILLLDVAHTAAEYPATPDGNISLSRSAADPHTIIMTSAVLLSGGLSGRSPLGGVWIYFYAEVSAQPTNASALPLPRLGVWANNTFLPPTATLNASMAANSLGGFIDFGAGPMVITVRTGISYVSSAAAQVNLYLEQQLQALSETQLQMQAQAEGEGPRVQRGLRVSGKAHKARGKRPHGTGRQHFGSAATVGTANTAVPALPTSGTWLTFEQVASAASALWEATLSRVAVTLPADLPPAFVQGNLTVFYSALYRTFLAPTTYSEPSGGVYMGMDGLQHALTDAPGPSGAPYGIGRYVSDLSIWDIHRSLAPLLRLTAPDVAADTAGSLLTMAAQGGHLPRWPLANVYTGCMDGSHALIIIADYIIKSLPGVNASAAYAAAVAALAVQEAGYYSSVGYVPIEQSNIAASSTLEYAYDDAAGAAIASAVGQSAQAALWNARAQNYRNVWNSSAQLFCPRSNNLAFSCPAIPSIPYPIASGVGYTEGDALQYQTFVPHDQAGLVSLFPSPDAFVAALQTLQAKQASWALGNAMPNPYYWAGNEPDILAPWQFAAAGPQYANYTQFWTRWLLRAYYTPSPDGIPGNDDFGTMSAWAAFAYAGLYPIPATPGGQYALGSPSFASFTVSLPQALACPQAQRAGAVPTGVAAAAASAAEGARVTASVAVLQITAHNASAANIYVCGASANGVALPTPFVTHTQLFPSSSALACAGGNAVAQLEFWMSDMPCDWAPQV